LGTPIFRKPPCIPIKVGKKDMKEGAPVDEPFIFGSCEAPFENPALDASRSLEISVPTKILVSQI